VADTVIKAHCLHSALVLMHTPTPDREATAEQCFLQALTVTSFGR